MRRAFRVIERYSYEWHWWKPKGNRWQEDGSLERQMQDQNWILECKNCIRDRKAGSSHSWDETLQPHVFVISESRWTGSGRHKINTGETVLYSGREDDQHHEGEAIILKKGLEKCLMGWKPINSRLLKVRLKGRHINTTIIQCYAPTNDCEEDDLALVSHTQQHMQEKTTRLSTCAQQVGLTISQKKTEVILLSVSKPRPV